MIKGGDAEWLRPQECFKACRLLESIMPIDGLFQITNYVVKKSTSPRRYDSGLYWIHNGKPGYIMTKHSNDNAYENYKNKSPKQIDDIVTYIVVNKDKIKSYEKA